jgi:hypothetical protein
MEREREMERGRERERERGGPRVTGMPFKRVTLSKSGGLSCVQAGHALAAASEGVAMHYSAVFLLFLLPGAFVALDSDTLALLSPSRTLRVCIQTLILDFGNPHVDYVT